MRNLVTSWLAAGHGRRVGTRAHDRLEYRARAAVTAGAGRAS